MREEIQSKGCVVKNFFNNLSLSEENSLDKIMMSLLEAENKAREGTLGAIDFEAKLLNFFQRVPPMDIEYLRRLFKSCFCMDEQSKEYFNNLSISRVLILLFLVIDLESVRKIEFLAKWIMKNRSKDSVIKTLNTMFLMCSKDFFIAIKESEYVYTL